MDGVVHNLTRVAVGVAAILTPSAATACLPPIVIFGFGSASIRQTEEPGIGRVVEAFKAQRHGRVKLTAQTDGSRTNWQMSQRRAQAVKAALVRRGVPAPKIDTVTKTVSQHDERARLVWMEVQNATCG